MLILKNKCKWKSLLLIIVMWKWDTLSHVCYKNKSELGKNIKAIYNTSKIMCAYTHIHSFLEKYFAYNIDMDIDF